MHEGLFRVLDERLHQVIVGTGNLPCDTCQYRVPMSPIANDVGGLKALLWSVRHITTHSQAMPHLHAHKPMRKHVLVCGNVDCASRGSVMLAGTLRRLLKRAGHEQSVRVTKTGCMGRCGEGPTVAVYPDGIWYRGVKVEDAPELVNEHFVNDRLVARLVDAIMQ
jgi:(2Fe-2S) ferredoxin